MTFFEINTGSSGGALGPFLVWQARESTDGKIPGRNFVMRDGTEKTIVTEAFEKGVVFDLPSLKTGWCYSTGMAGQAPQWKWNSSLKDYMPSPGDGWKKGLAVKIALNAKTVVTLEQSSAAIMAMLSDIGALVRAPEAQNAIASGKLPVIRLKEIEKVDSKLGTTFVPRVEIAKWVDRPEILGASGMEISTGDNIASKEPAKKTKAAAEEEALEF